MGAVVDALNRPEFLSGLRVGAAVFGVGLLLALAWHSAGDHSAIPLGGLLLCVAVIIGLDTTGRLPHGLVLGLTALAVAGLIAHILDASSLAFVVLLVPGASVVASAGNLPDDLWLRGVVVLGTVSGAVLMTDFDGRWGDVGASHLLLPVTTAGIFATVPDTEQSLVLLGAALVLAVLGWPLIGYSLGPGGSSAIAGVLAWTAASGGHYRPSAVIAGIASLGVLAVEPVSRWLAGEGGGPFDRIAKTAHALTFMTAVHLALVLTISRVAGLQESLRLGLAISVTALVTTTLALAMGTRRAGNGLRGRPSQPSHRRARRLGEAVD